MKNYIVVILSLLFVALTSSAQSALEGEYYYSYGGKAQITKLSAGRLNLKVEATFVTDAFELEFETLVKDKIYFIDSYSQGKYRLELMDEGYIRFISLSDGMEVEGIEVLATEKKVAKNAAKEEQKNNLGKILTTGVTSPFHEEHAHQIVFFESRPEMGQEEAANPKTNFVLGEEIWAVLYLAQPLKYYGFEEEAKLDLEYLIMDGSSGTYIGDWVFKFNEAEIDTTTFIRFQMLPSFDASPETLAEYSYTFAGLQEETEEYDYDITVRIDDFEEFINIDCSQNRERLDEVVNISFAGAIADNELPAAYMSDPYVESDILMQLQSIARQEGWEEEFQEVYLASDFQVMEDSYGYIEGKAVAAVATAKWPDGRCSYQYFNFYYKYEGGGQYSDVLLFYGYGQRGFVSCDKIE